MYLHEDFIACIKGRFAHAHPGNVNQLLESFNKLAGAGVTIEIETDWVANCERMRLYNAEKGLTSLIRLPMLYTDVECVSICRELAQLSSCLL